MELLVQIGEYRAGSDAQADRAIGMRPTMLDFLRQAPESAQPFEKTVAQLQGFGG
jgi:type III secretion protein N (ATPase)